MAHSATTWDPQNALYWYYLGRTKYAENHFEEAIAAFRQCLTLHPRDVRTEYNLGLAYAGLGHNADAIAAYRTAIEWQQNTARPDPQPWLDLGILFLDQNQPQPSPALAPKGRRACPL